MEPHPGRLQGPQEYPMPGTVSLLELWNAALRYVQNHEELRDQLAQIAKLRFEDVTPAIFWGEYIWVVFVSGLNASVIAGKWDKILKAVGPWSKRGPEADWGPMLVRLHGIMPNKYKAQALATTRNYMHILGWKEFKAQFLDGGAESMQNLGYIGPITCWHLARNLGMDVAKPDIHLRRLAKEYGYEEYNVEIMCRNVGRMGAAESGSPEGEGIYRVGAVDFVLWAFCAAVGTIHLEKETP